MTESPEQKELVKWFRDTYPQYAKSIRLSMSGINLGGGRKAAIMINFLKAMGMVDGESDLVFLVPSSGFHGLVLEFKATEGKHPLKPNQAEYLDYMASLGYAAMCCKGLEAAKESITQYLTISD